MSVDHELFETVRHPLRMRRLHVTRVERPTPRLARVTLAGDDLDGFRSDGPGDHVKVFFPAPGEDEPWLPQLGPAGIVPTPGAPRPIARDYTPKHQSLGERVLQLDIVLHDGGMASGWAAHAEPGRVLGVAGPRGSHVLRPGVAGLVLVGDETALPAIQNFLHGAAPGLPVLAIVEVQDEQDVQPLESAADVTARWVFRRDVAPGHAPRSSTSSPPPPCRPGACCTGRPPRPPSPRASACTWCSSDRSIPRSCTRAATGSSAPPTTRSRTTTDGRSAAGPRVAVGLRSTAAVAPHALTTPAVCRVW